MIEIDTTGYDWIDVRHAFSLGLAKGKSCKLLNTRSFTAETSVSAPVLADMAAVVKNINAGTIEVSDDSILFSAGAPVPGTYELFTGNYSSTVELLLFLLPSFLYLDFRTVLNCHGVTHSSSSYPTGFLKETILPFIEKMGYYSSLNLKRFGFYGTGEGSFEARIYPQEGETGKVVLPEGVRKTENARIYISGIKTDLAKQQKQILMEELQLEDKAVSIIEILDCKGPGNSIQVAVNHGSDVMIFSKEVSFYNSGGDYIYEEETAFKTLKVLIDDIKEFCIGNLFSNPFIREITPFVFLHSGLVAVESLKLKKESKTLLKQFL